MPRALSWFHIRTFNTHVDIRRRANRTRILHDGGVRLHKYSLDGNEDRNPVPLLVDMATKG